MGVFSRGQLPPSLEAVAFSLPPGMVSELVDTSFGYHILRVESREPARAPSLEESQARIRALLSRQKSDQKIRQYVADLMARAKVNHEAARIPPRPS
jgi:parvulin-like peptidyl-prolyl isomerase